MNQHTVAQRWVKQSHPKCKTRTFFFKGDTIYSYGRHWPLGRIITLADSKRKVALINDVFYSSSTSRHHSQAWSAAHDARNLAVKGIRPQVDGSEGRIFSHEGWYRNPAPLPDGRVRPWNGKN